MPEIRPDWISELEAKIVNISSTPQNISDVKVLNGGSVNRSYLVNTDKGSYFVKLNVDKTYPNLFQLETQGIETLTEKACLALPEILAHGKIEENAYLLMEYIQPSMKGQSFWTDFGAGLAKLHLHQSRNFGFTNDNYIGSIIQSNNWTESWAEFFVVNRMEWMEKIARDNDLIDQELSKGLARLYPKIENLFPNEPPALLHGDLWSGNFLVNQNGSATLIDPAVYYGHREMDIAMSLLFGGFDSQFYSSYQNNYPLEKGWEERIELCNLFPLLVHVILFGSSYSNRVKNSLKRYI